MINGQTGFINFDALSRRLLSEYDDHVCDLRVDRGWWRREIDQAGGMFVFAEQVPSYYRPP